MARQYVDVPTVMGWAAMLVPLLTMWHEIGGHAASCAILGGRIVAIGAFYVQCGDVAGLSRMIVAVAGVLVNTALAIGAYAVWRRARTDSARLVLWLVWVSEAFVAAGYFCFSGATDFGDLGTGVGGGLYGLPMPIAWRIGELAFGIIAYILIVRAAIRSLSAMVGDSPATRPTRRRISHGYYAAAGIAAVLTGLLNPVGLTITIMSAAASSFGGLAGFISIGFAVPSGEMMRPFVLRRSWPVVVTGAAVLMTFAIVLGPSITF